jgi:hypothetical protein
LDDFLFGPTFFLVRVPDAHAETIVVRSSYVANNDSV